MRPTSRQQKIFSLLEKQGMVSVSELADMFAVSENTIRNDLVALAEQDLVERTHGGAILQQFRLPPQLRPKASQLSPKSSHMISYAAAWIEDGDSLIIGDSQLCVQLAERMTHLHNLRVITTSMAVAYTLAQENTNSVVLAGGELDPMTYSTRGSMAETAVRNFHADKAFFSCTGVSAQNGLTDFSSENAAIRRQMKEAATSVFILVESDRVGKIDLFSIGNLSEARRIVTDDNLSHDEAQNLADTGASRVTVCWDGGHRTHRQRPAAGRTMRVGFANLSDKVWFSYAVRQSLEAVAKTIPDLEVLITDNENRLDKTIANAKYFLEQDIDLLIEYDGTGSASRPVRRLMRQAEVPVIAVDIPMVAATHFGSDHDAVGVSAGSALLQWINTNWQGKVDTILLLNNEGGGTMVENWNLHMQDWSREEYLGTLRPATRLHAALEMLQDGLSVTPEVHQITLPGDWPSSEVAVETQQAMLKDVLAEIPKDNLVAAISLVPEGAISFARAAREADRCNHFVIISFGHDCLAIRDEFSRANSCLMGIIDLHPDRYGEEVLRTAVRILKGEAVPPAVFVQHNFVSKEDLIVSN